MTQAAKAAQWRFALTVAILAGVTARPAMSFRSLYRHGFARVAACTTRTALADPAVNAQTILRMAEDCDRQAVAGAVFPELGLSGYAISDLLQQTAMLDAVETAIDVIVAGSAALM